jgi:hypothetical protein
MRNRIEPRDALHFRMQAAWQARCATVAVGAALVVSCASESNVAPPREAAPTATESASPLSALQRTAPLSLDERAAWRRALDWPVSCEEAFESSRVGEDGGLAIYALAPGVSLVEVLCASGAYQPSHVYLRYDERGPSPVTTLLEFPVFLAAEEGAPTTSLENEIWGESSLSPEASTLSVLALSRQLADCGVWSRYALDSERPRLIAAAAKLPCPASPGAAAELAADDPPPGWRPLSIAQ